MPTYAYACTECDHRFEVVQSFEDDALTVCPECEGRLRKVFNAVGIVFKGGGFYRTDSRSSANGGAGGSRAGASTSGSSESTGSPASGDTAGASTSSSKDSASGTPSSSGSSSGGSSSTPSASPAPSSTSSG